MDGSKGRIELEWSGEATKGIACDMDSAGFHAISEATKEVFISVIA